MSEAPVIQEACSIPLEKSPIIPVDRYRPGWKPFSRVGRHHDWPGVLLRDVSCLEVFGEEVCPLALGLPGSLLRVIFLMTFAITEPMPKASPCQTAARSAFHVLKPGPAWRGCLWREWFGCSPGREAVRGSCTIRSLVRSVGSTRHPCCWSSRAKPWLCSWGGGFTECSCSWFYVELKGCMCENIGFQSYTRSV